MLIWDWATGDAHIVKEQHDDEWITGCGNAVPGEPNPETSKEAPNLHGRPFGADTCSRCHAVVKQWAANPDGVPETIDLSAPPPPARMTAAERAAAVRGEAKEGISVTREPAGRPRARMGAEDSDDAYDDATSPAVVSGGALVVKPAKKTRKPVDLLPEIDSD